MEQSLRNQYLETLGIVSWLPRRQLPGARPTPDWVWEYCWPQPATAADVATTASAPILKPADRAHAAKQARAELSASFGAEQKPASAGNAPATAAPARPEVEVPPTAPSEAVPVTAVADITLSESVDIDLPDPAAQTEQKPFKLAFMVYQDCLVIDSLPPVSVSARAQLNSGQADAHHQILLDKILRSIGLSGGSAAEFYTLPWPMFASKSLDQGAEQARLTVQHKLKKSLQKNPVSTVLLLGESAAQMVLERTEPLDQLRGMLFSLRSSVKTLASASLTEMMMVPGCKREVWQDLQPLLDHLEKQPAGDER
ncbi:hypothetical protein [Amphritea pacifica]|uniref:Uracil-DNA glycosylase-like domain-containing protein n=1 Tax=Amphritea pacifica TaxID=2811233 RepID=A0ABS2W407_9GAMM|nr:hypothetical protein [Amphritea pacifica]MBN0986438.1 hypothetical protein [Amphritea pacifica]MBN1006418.1 hypothetical protein [Amphritea pacifica]